MSDEQRKDAMNRDDSPPASPYGPQPNGTDGAAGGADSSPYENMSSDERARLAKVKRKVDEEPRH